MSTVSAEAGKRTSPTGNGTYPYDAFVTTFGPYAAGNYAKAMALWGKIVLSRKNAKNYFLLAIFPYVGAVVCGAIMSQLTGSDRAQWAMFTMLFSVLAVAWLLFTPLVDFSSRSLKNWRQYRADLKIFRDTYGVDPLVHPPSESFRDFTARLNLRTQDD